MTLRMKWDSYLTHALEAARDQQRTERGGLESLDSEAAADDVRLPMLMQVDPSRFRAKEIKDLQVTSVMGNIVAGTGTVRSLEALETDPAVFSVEASRRAGVADTATSIPFVRGNVVHRPPLSESGSCAITGIIDAGIDILHECFRDAAGLTRFEAVWDQRDNSGPSPAARGAPAGLNYGTMHTRADIASHLVAGTAPGGLGRDLNGHGTHVTSIAAGRPAGSFQGGMAPDARIVFVRPKLSVSPGDRHSIGYSLSHVDALSFINHMATDLDLPVVVNVSLGMNAGAHDGSSLLEAAFDQFSEGGRKPGRVIVKSAGNERGKDGHAKLALGSQGLDSFKWESRSAHVGPDNLEIWFHPADDLRFRLKAPNGDATIWVERNTPSLSGHFAFGTRYDLSLDRYYRDNGDSRLLVTIAGTASRLIPAGDFELDVESRAVAAGGRVDAWIEREDTRPIGFSRHLNDEITLSIPGTARTVISVASVKSSFPMAVSRFSSMGPSRDDRQKPDISAPGDDIIGGRGGTATGDLKMSGTSQAAPHVTGAVALLLSYCNRHNRPIPNALQVGSALRNTAQNFNGWHTTDRGYGLFDAEALLRSLM